MRSLQVLRRGDSGEHGMSLARRSLKHVSREWYQTAPLPSVSTKRSGGGIGITSHRWSTADSDALMEAAKMAQDQYDALEKEAVLQYINLFRKYMDGLMILLQPPEALIMTHTPKYKHSQIIAGDKPTAIISTEVIDALIASLIRVQKRGQKASEDQLEVSSAALEALTKLLINSEVARRRFRPTDIILRTIDCVAWINDSSRSAAVGKSAALDFVLLLVQEYKIAVTDLSSDPIFVAAVQWQANDRVAEHLSTVMEENRQLRKENTKLKEAMDGLQSRLALVEKKILSERQHRERLDSEMHGRQDRWRNTFDSIEQYITSRGLEVPPLTKVAPLEGEASLGHYIVRALDAASLYIERRISHKIGERTTEVNENLTKLRDDLLSPRNSAERPFSAGRTRSPDVSTSVTPTVPSTLRNIPSLSSASSVPETKGVPDSLVVGGTDESGKRRSPTVSGADGASPTTIYMLSDEHDNDNDVDIPEDNEPSDDDDDTERALSQQFSRLTSQEPGTRRAVERTAVDGRSAVRHARPYSATHRSSPGRISRPLSAQTRPLSAISDCASISSSSDVDRSPASFRPQSAMGSLGRNGNSGASAAPSSATAGESPINIENGILAVKPYIDRCLYHYDIYDAQDEILHLATHFSRWMTRTVTAHLPAASPASSQPIHRPSSKSSSSTGLGESMELYENMRKWHRGFTSELGRVKAYVRSNARFVRRKAVQDSCSRADRVVDGILGLLKVALEDLTRVRELYRRKLLSTDFHRSDFEFDALRLEELKSDVLLSLLNAVLLFEVSLPHFHTSRGETVLMGFVSATTQQLQVTGGDADVDEYGVSLALSFAGCIVTANKTDLCADRLCSQEVGSHLKKWLTFSPKLSKPAAIIVRSVVKSSRGLEHAKNTVCIRPLLDRLVQLTQVEHSDGEYVADIAAALKNAVRDPEILLDVKGHVALRPICELYVRSWKEHPQGELTRHLQSFLVHICSRDVSIRELVHQHGVSASILKVPYRR